jgi:hypothetical protein
VSLGLRERAWPNAVACISKLVFKVVGGLSGPGTPNSRCVKLNRFAWGTGSTLGLSPQSHAPTTYYIVLHLHGCPSARARGVSTLGLGLLQPTAPMWARQPAPSYTRLASLSSSTSSPPSQPPSAPGSLQSEGNRQCQAMFYHQHPGETDARIHRAGIQSGTRLSGFPRIYAISYPVCLVSSHPPLSLAWPLAHLVANARSTIENLGCLALTDDCNLFHMNPPYARLPAGTGCCTSMLTSPVFPR